MADVGIVMPVYHQKSRYLRLAIQSVLRQSYRHFRLVIVLDGATGKESAIAREMTKGDKRVRIIKCAHNHGVASALNRGFHTLLKNRELRYLTWVSSDNIYYPEFLLQLRHKLRHSPSSVGLVYSSFFHIDEQGHKAEFLFHNIREFRQWQQQPKVNLLDNCFVGVAFLYKRRIADKIGGYRMEPVEDYDYWLRLTDHCDIRYIPKELMEYRLSSPHSISKQLQNSVWQHRRWRHAFQLAKLETRYRRNIPRETTAIFFAASPQESTVSRAEHLYEQYYSDFSLLVIDTTTNQSATSVIQDVPDPRLEFIHYPNVDVHSAIQSVLSSISTPFIYINCEHVTLAQFELFNLAKTLRSAPPDVVSAFVDANHVISLTREKQLHAPNITALYRTSLLKG